VSTPKTFVVTRRHLRDACDAKQWDLLDRLLEMDKRAIDDDALYGEDGDHWGLLVECIRNKDEDGVTVLLARGADRTIGIWGDGASYAPVEVAEGQAGILALLAKDEVAYVRKAEPELPAPDDTLDPETVIRSKVGLVLPRKR
jgi:hypothetical protein